MFQYYRKNKNRILNLSLKKIYSHFFLNDIKSNSYYAYLKKQVFKFLQSKYPNYQIENFEKHLERVITNIADYKDITPSLNLLFKPTFNDDMQFHYKYNENRMFFDFIKYSLNIKLVKGNYSDVYDFAIDKLKEPLNILEIGGGIPHGFIYNHWRRDRSFFNCFNYIDADLLHSEFVKWYCEYYKFDYQINLFPAAKVPKIENVRFNFVFAKDVFEHLDEPSLLINNLITKIKDNKTLLCLDLEPKSPHNIQHLSPNLSDLKKILISNEFKMIKEFRDVHVWTKI